MKDCKHDNNYFCNHCLKLEFDGSKIFYIDSNENYRIAFIKPRVLSEDEGELSKVLYNFPGIGKFNIELYNATYEVEVKDGRKEIK